MANINNLQILTEFGELVYNDAESLNISFNRVVDDFTGISNRFGEFSYDFDLPIVKENSIVFGYANAIGNKKIFPKNRNISCQVYLNNALLLDGLINLEAVTQTNYKCKFFSKFKELIDTLNAVDPNTNEEKTLKNLGLPIINDWHYEKSVINHINTFGELDSDATTHQFPLAFYSTFYCQESYYLGHNDIKGNVFQSDRDNQNYYYLLNNIGGDDNRMYIHQLPPALYIVSIVKQILSDAGWKLGGQFFLDSNVKKIVLTYAGDDDIYDQATHRVSGSTGHTLTIAHFLPDMSPAKFLENIINYFNLYFKVDVANKIIEFETYDTYFNTASINPYDITEKVILDTIEISYIENNNPSISFSKPNNANIMGDNYFMSGATDNAYTQVWITGSNKNFNQTFNRVGTTDKIDLDFSAPTIMRKIIYNNKNIAGVDKAAGMMYFYLPILSKQTQYDNNSMKFNKQTGDTYVFNNESSIKYQGDGCLMYHYGKAKTDFENKAGDGGLSDFLYINIPSGATLMRTAFTVCSPFQLMSYRTDVEAWLNGVNLLNSEDRRTAVATYLQALWQIMGTSTGITAQQATDFSLCFDDNGYFHNTLWSKFHQNKWDTYANSEQVIVDMRMNSYDWQQLQINRPILYNQELYSLIAIDGYNPIRRTATIKMIQKL